MPIPTVYGEYVSECCGAKINEARNQGVLVGHCSKCNKAVCRLNPRTARAEWLEGRPPRTKAALRPMGLPAGWRPGAKFPTTSPLSDGQGQGG